ncbi:hypothetical protein AB0F42_28690 [Streptomyces buecherae]|uniref:hypothetical protein n=1 Tax=Streptomyces buecherae TaxID=2763006 RepID=UPI0033CD2A98
MLAGLGAGVAYAGYLFLLRGRGTATGPRYRFLPVTLATVTAGRSRCWSALSDRTSTSRRAGPPSVGWPRSR